MLRKVKQFWNDEEAWMEIGNSIHDLGPWVLIALVMAIIGLAA